MVAVVAPPPGTQCLGCLMYRHGSQPGLSSIRDEAVYADFVQRKAEILAAIGDRCGRAPPAPDSAPLLCMQPTLSAELEGAVFSVSNTVAELLYIGGDVRGLAPAQPRVQFSRKAVVIQNMSKLGGEQLYKVFRPKCGAGATFEPAALLANISHFSNLQVRLLVLN